MLENGEPELMYKMTPYICLDIQEVVECVNLLNQDLNKPVTIDMGRLEDWPISHLRKACQKNKVKGYTKMSKDELAQEVRKILKEVKSNG